MPCLFCSALVTGLRWESCDSPPVHLAPLSCSPPTARRRTRHHAQIWEEKRISDLSPCPWGLPLARRRCPRGSAAPRLRAVRAEMTSWPPGIFVVPRPAGRGLALGCGRLDGSSESARSAKAGVRAVRLSVERADQRAARRCRRRRQRVPTAEPLQRRDSSAQRGQLSLEIRSLHQRADQAISHRTAQGWART